MQKFSYMKTGNPYDKENLSIKKRERVLEVGPGNNPTRRANTLVEKFLMDNRHRRGNLRIFAHQALIEADGENLPIKDKEYDYVICSHVMEHTEDPLKFAAELSRVAKRGYVEVPSLIGELLGPKSSHKWVILEIEDKLVFYEKSKLPYKFGADFGNLLLHYLPNQSLPFRLSILSRTNLTSVRYEWRDNIDIIVNPQDERLESYFTKAWTEEMTKKMFPPRSASNEMCSFLKALLRFSIDKIGATIDLRKGSLTLDEYSARTAVDRKK